MLVIIIIFFTAVKTIPLNLTDITTTACHAGQQQQPGLARGGGVSCHTNGAELLTVQSARPSLDLVSIHQLAPPKV